MNNKEYKIAINPRILELLGPSLYTNIYYVLAELIANAYDADAHNVYIIVSDDKIVVEDDGCGMSYEKGEIDKYLNVASVSRTNSNDSKTKMGRMKMGRKGVGKLAALSVSENVLVKTVSNNEKSGFVLSRNIGEDHLLKPLENSEIGFEFITENGTAIVMEKPQYKLHSTLSVIKKNLLKIFPLVNKDFVIHIIKNHEENIISDFDKTVISELSTLQTFGNKFSHLCDLFDTSFDNERGNLCKKADSYKIPIKMESLSGTIKEYNVEIEGWIGTYKSTRGRKLEMTDFPDNFISLFANEKMGEFNILPAVGQNKLSEVFVVGQLHVDIFELTELPDIALSNRQGYKSDDIRYKTVLEHVKNNILPEILRMRDIYVSLTKKEKETIKLLHQKDSENKLRESVDNFRKKTANNAAEKLSKRFNIGNDRIAEIESIVADEINSNSPDIGIKKLVDSQKKRILISQTYRDKDLADIIYNMLIYNGVLPEDIIYTNCDDEVSRIPEGEVGKSGIYNYLRDFFVDSYSTQKMFVIFVTSQNTKESWGAITEVGAAWITQIEHKIFNIRDFRPEHPLDDESQWHTSSRDKGGNLYMSKLSEDIFCQKIEYICDFLGYSHHTRNENKTRLETLVSIK